MPRLLNTPGFIKSLGEPEVSSSHVQTQAESSYQRCLSPSCFFVPPAILPNYRRQPPGPLKCHLQNSPQLCNLTQCVPIDTEVCNCKFPPEGSSCSLTCICDMTTEWERKEQNHRHLHLLKPIPNYRGHSSSPVVLKLRSQNQQQHHYLQTC